MTAESLLRDFANKSDDGSLTVNTDLTREQCLTFAEEIGLCCDNGDYADETYQEGGWIDVWGDCPDICGEFRIHLVPAH